MKKTIKYLKENKKVTIIIAVAIILLVIGITLLFNVSNNENTKIEGENTIIEKTGLSKEEALDMIKNIYHGTYVFDVVADSTNMQYVITVTNPKTGKITKYYVNAYDKTYSTVE